MAAAFESGVAGLLQAWSRGDANALERVVVLVYPELRRIAHRCLAGERPGHTLQSTALVNEAYIRLVDIRSIEWRDRAHFFAVGARIRTWLAREMLSGETLVASAVTDRN